MNKKNMKYVFIVLSIIIICFYVYRRYKNKSYYSYPVLSTETSAPSTNFTSNLNKCDITYLLSINSGTSTTVAATTRDNCVTSNTVMYVNTMCPHLPKNTTSATAINAGTGLVGTTSNTAYTAYNTAVTAINNAYLTLEATEQDSTVLGYIIAARNADVLGPIRKFYSTLCPGVYNSNTISDNVTSVYNTWAVGSATYGWNSANVTRARIIEWSKYASTAPTIADGTGAYTNTITLTESTTALKAGCTLFNNTTSPNTDPNYIIARTNGPGTVNTSMSFPWNAITATCA
jgi:hypothetical protein